MSETVIETADKRRLVKRYAIFTVGLFLCSLGVSLITRSDLGTSPISSTPYVASLHSSLSMGTYVFLLNLLLIAGQLLMLDRKQIRSCRFDLILQLPVSVIFGLFIDLTMGMLEGFRPEAYIWKAGGLMAGCIVMATGIALEVIADVTMNSGEYFVQIASRRFKLEFGNVKLGFDVSLVVFAVLLSLLLAHRIDGVREGTVVTALLTGPVVRLLRPRMRRIDAWIGEVPARKETEKLGFPAVITLSREYGSGGHEIGKRIAKELGIAFYDKEIIRQAAVESGWSVQKISRKEQHIPNRLLYETVLQDYEAPSDRKMSSDEELFSIQSRIIRRMAEKGPCLIVGRCADAVLRDFPSVVRVFLHASPDCKLKRAVEEYGLPAETAAAEIERINKARATHYRIFTGKNWGDSRNYSLCCDTGLMDAEQIEKIVCALYREVSQKK